MRRVLQIVGVAVLLGGCVQDMVYLRVDGQRASLDPVLAQQFEVDRAICAGEMQKANVSGVTFAGGGMAGLAAQIERQQAVGQVAQGCMAQRGYLLVNKDDADTKAAELAAVAQEKKRREAAAAQEAAKPAQAKRKISAPVKKSNEI